MTNLVKGTLFLAFGILGGFCLSWGNVAFFFIFIPILALAFFPQKLTWWCMLLAATGHGFGFGIMRGMWEGTAFGVVSLGIYLILWKWRRNAWIKRMEHAASE